MYIYLAMIKAEQKAPVVALSELNIVTSSGSKQAWDYEPTVSSVEFLREFVNERLTAAEEIFGVFRKTVLEYEEVIDRQRRLLDIAWKPEIQLNRTELPQQHVCKEEEVLADQQLCIQERNSSLDQEDPEPPQIKEEQEELCSSQEGEQLVLKQETDVFMWIPAYEESDDSEPEPNRDHQLLSHSSHVAESQDQARGKHENSGSTRDAEPESRHHENRSHSNNVHNSTRSQIYHNPHTEGKGVEEEGEACLGRSRNRGNPEIWNVNIQKMRRMRGQTNGDAMPVSGLP
ncbi:uncharacterized protein LOC123959851 [Micropterus dolomieu]|uniref:uncharacterized protein LOC123959851 n=1 Tax=Micropterus dolomieu TaxID=147949 RepID=UPI001E8CEC4C|nr:uncharacterized protein LOC123959851 [Micropterus dolomieu]